MYKKLIHNRESDIKMFFKLYVFLIVWFFVFSCCNADLLDHSLRKISKDIDTKAASKSVVKDIYLSSLNQQKYDELQSISDSVSSTKTMLNNVYCLWHGTLLTDQDLINILYFADSSFRSEVDSLSDTTLAKPKYGDMTWSCLKYNKCVWRKLGKSSLYLTGDYGCLKNVPIMFQKISTDKSSISTLTDKIEWSEYFWNWSLDDSKFDLLSDVFDVAKLLFGESEAQEPPETVFFDMPVLNNADGAYNSNVSTVINRFWPHNSTSASSSDGSSRWASPYQNWSNQTANVANWSKVNNWARSAESNDSSSEMTAWDSARTAWDSARISNQTLKWNNDNTLSINEWKIQQYELSSNEIQRNIEWIDQDIENFITTVNSTEYESDNVATLSMWNECVSWFSYQYSSNYVITETGIIWIWTWWQEFVQWEEEQQTVDEYLESVLEQVHALQCNNDYICDSWESSTCPDCVWIVTWNTTVDEVSNMLNNLEMGEGEEISQQTVSCVGNCFDTQTKPDTILLCVAKCFCTDVWSDVGIAGMTSSFRLKFCVVPAIWQEYQRKKYAYSVWEFFNTMNDLAIGLREWGNTLTAVKTKSFFDSSYVKNNFAKQLSFSIVTEQKNQVSQKTQKEKDDAAKKVNTDLSNSVLWFSENATTESEKNKYIVAQEYVTNVVDVADYQQKQEINESFKNETVIIVDSRFQKFMQINSEFRSDIASVLESFNTQSKMLKSKPRS